MFWALGAHFGRGVSQSARGDVLGQVRDETPPGPGGKRARLYQPARIVAARGPGADRRPDVRAPGARRRLQPIRVGAGDPQRDPRDAAGPDAGAVPRLPLSPPRRGSARRRPPSRPTTSRCSARRGGKVSVFFVGEIFNAAFRELKRAFTPEEIDAIDTFRATAQPAAVRDPAGGRRGDLPQQLHVMHARSEFEDWEEPDNKRLMLRLWLDAERNVRPVVPHIHIYENAGGRSGIDPQPGRLPAACGLSRARRAGARSGRVGRGCRIGRRLTIFSGRAMLAADSDGRART